VLIQASYACVCCVLQASYTCVRAVLCSAASEAEVVIQVVALQTGCLEGLLQLLLELL
jgi:hypothetical protein